MNPIKVTYSHNYWIEQLITAGKSIEPEKYSEAYCATIRKAWQGQPLTRLHLMVIKRKQQVKKAT